MAVTGSKNSSNVAEGYNDLSNLERVRIFWEETTLPQKDFDKMLCHLLQKDHIILLNDFNSPEIIKYLLKNYITVIQEAGARAKRSDSERCWVAICHKIAQNNIQQFLDNEYSDGILAVFFDELIRFTNDNELAFSLLLNFIRNIARNDLRYHQVESEVDLGPGISDKIWKKAAEKYLPREYVV